MTTPTVSVAGVERDADDRRDHKSEHEHARAVGERHAQEQSPAHTVRGSGMR
jgi:hypothetical protein